MSRRLIDMCAERQLSEFLDENFWGPLCASQPSFSFSRVSERALQLQGVDVVFSIGEKSVYIDEKAQLYYINQNLPTFAFEIDSFQRGFLTEGWLLNDNLLTTKYHLIYPNAKHSDLSNLTKHDFTQVEVLSISKERLLSMLAQLGFTKSYLIEKSRDIRFRAGTDRYEELSCNPMIKFVKSASSKYSEAPLNIVIRKSLLIELADSVIKVWQKGYTIKKNNKSCS